jgi:hypothetical protein
MGRMRTAREKAEEKSEARNPKSETNKNDAKPKTKNTPLTAAKPIWVIIILSI